MGTVVIVLISLALGAGLAAVVVSRRRTPDAAVSSITEELRRLSHQVSLENNRVAERLEGIDTRMNITQNASTGMAQDIFERLGEVQTATEAVATQAREFTQLQDILKAPKARGGLGEAMLEEVLREILPPRAYSMQHRFRSGRIVDAVVKAGGKLVCIDSKFPMANYTRMCDATDEIERADAERSFAGDVAKHIGDISTRYIVPDEDTFDFAVMFVPAEGVYGEVLRLYHRKQPLYDLAMTARVVPMSPLTISGYLQTVLLGLKCMSIEEDAQRVLKVCGQLHQDFARFTDEYDVLGRHLTNARNKYDEGRVKIDRFRSTIDRVVDLTDGPSTDDEDRPPLEAVGD